MQLSSFVKHKSTENPLPFSICPTNCHKLICTLLQFMASSFPIKILIFLALIHIPSNAQLQSNEKGSISVTISEKGLDFLKDLLIDTAVSTLTPLELPQIEKYVKIPLVGKVHIVLSDIMLYHIDVPYSYLKSEDDNLVIAASGATANLSLRWRYYYKTWIIEVSDEGDASVQVKDMEVSLTVDLKNQDGKPKFALLESDCNVEDINIDVDGGVSWLYQVMVDAFGDKIESAVQDAILKKIKSGLLKIDSRLQSLPKEIPVDDTSALNVTLVDNPSLTGSSVAFEINGLFVARDNNVLKPKHRPEESRVATSFREPRKMISISLHEDVFNSASKLYCNAEYLQWTVDKLPNQSLLNTTEWRQVAPQLYEQFPDDRMILNVSISAPSVISISDDNVEATIFTDVTIDVLDNEDVIPVACLSAVLSSSASAEIVRNNLTGSVKLEDLVLTSKWSKFDDVPMHQVEPIISDVLESLLLPPLNARLSRGFPLPLVHGFKIQNAEILYTDSRITVCSDVSFVDDYDFNLLLPTLNNFASLFSVHITM